MSPLVNLQSICLFMHDSEKGGGVEAGGGLEVGGWGVSLTRAGEGPAAAALGPASLGLVQQQ